MKIHRLEREQRLEHPLDEVFGFFAAARNLERLTPPWLRFEVLTPEPIEMRAGTLIDYRLRVHGIPLRWTSRIEEWEPGRGFIDRQLRGPYGLWYHRHSFAADGVTTVVRDAVDYGLALGPLGELAHQALVRRDLERIFDYRRQAVLDALGTGPAEEGIAGPRRGAL
ncbi:MAG: SRPBCC family protein [Solirubrobacteraceae bacterium]